MNKEQRDELEKNLQEKYMGAIKQGIPMLLDGGLKWSALSINPVDAQMLESRKFTRGRSDKDALPAPAPGTIADVPVVPFTGGPRDTLDMLRELRDMARRRTEDSGHIRECVRIIREETKKQTELLQEIAEDQRLEHRLNAERQHRH